MTLSLSTKPFFLKFLIVNNNENQRRRLKPKRTRTYLVVSYCGIHYYRHLIPVHPINRGASPTQPAPTTVTKEIPGAPTGGTFDHPSKPEKNVSLV